MTTNPGATSPLTPNAALGWLRSLSVDLTAAAVLDASGAVVAGDPIPAGGHVLGARSEHYTAIARIGPRAVARLVQADLQAAVDALEAP